MSLAHRRGNGYRCHYDIALQMANTINYANDSDSTLPINWMILSLCASHHCLRFHF